ncbi:MAG: YczE/YyaS/YitT family protein [Paraclostridium sp.]|uniref:YczE/YyaS/YitT family protein n=1 Tax=Paraclostridium sp. TaxID=2023273 RepID=UPI003F385E11
MKTKLLKFIRLMSGFVFCALGIVLMINANLGLAPWDVLHEGISKITGMTMGQSSILVGITVIAMDIFLGENLGWGTILNMVTIGWFMDILILNNLIPIANSISLGILMIALGMILMSIGCYLYIGAGVGSGARDGMMVAIQKRSGKSIRMVRNIIEVGVLIIGFLLGGTVGIGTVISSIGLGYCIQFIFKLFKFNVSDVSHRYIIDDIKSLKKFKNNKSQNEFNNVS